MSELHISRHELFARSAHDPASRFRLGTQEPPCRPPACAAVAIAASTFPHDLRTPAPADREKRRPCCPSGQQGLHSTNDGDHLGSKVAATTPGSTRSFPA